MRTALAVFAALLTLASCEAERSAGVSQCQTASVSSLHVQAGAAAMAGGFAVVQGTTAFAGAAGGLADGSVGPLAPATELAINAIYVGGAKVFSQDFNFRSWAVIVDASRLCANSAVLAGRSYSVLPVRLYVSGSAGVCIYDATDAGVVLPLPDGFCPSLSTMVDAGSGDAGGDAGPGSADAGDAGP